MIPWREYPVVLSVSNRNLLGCFKPQKGSSACGDNRAGHPRFLELTAWYTPSDHRVSAMKTCPSCHGNYSDSFVHCPRDGTLLAEADLWTEDMVIRGKYQILSKIGQGGMGAVYKALHLRFKELRALKVISPELMSNPIFLKRFEHEAVVTRRLQHPNAVRVEDVDEGEDGRPFIVMEYVEGHSLKEAIARQGWLPVRRACAIAKQIASALDAAHRLGMIHRDIKPENIILVTPPLSSGPLASARDTIIAPGLHEVGPQSYELSSALPAELAKVLDFGVAKIKEGLLEDASIGMTLTGADMVVGTPAYMSPEQALGKQGQELDGRSDIYSLGVVMYQMLAGELPLKADTPIQMMMAHGQTPPRPIKETRGGAQVPDAIAGLVMRCLEKDPSRRPANGRALIKEIEDWEEGLARPARGPADQEPAAREQAEGQRFELEPAEQERLAQDMPGASVELKPDRGPRGAAEDESAQTALYTQDRPHSSMESQFSATQLLNGGQVVSAAEVSRTEHDAGGPSHPREALAPTRHHSRRGLAIAAAAVGALLLGSAWWHFEWRSARGANKPNSQPQLSRDGAATKARPESPSSTTTVPLREGQQGKSNPLTTESRSPARSRSTATLAPAGTAASSSPARSAPGTVMENQKDGLKYVRIPPGTFMMGCSPGDDGCSENERPPHQVTITKGFWMGQTEVTVAAYRQYANAEVSGMPQGQGGELHPVVNVSWNDAAAYCQWAGGRLPTEAEWEYAARGGGTEARYGDIDDVAWYMNDSDGRPHDVAQKVANGFGLYDMLGNVWEWVSDGYDEKFYRNIPAIDPQGPTSLLFRGIRGGSWLNPPVVVRVSDRSGKVPSYRGDSVGFRCISEVR
jgi:eukaryotic-like serine/threonine-protein kinase